MKHFIIWLLCLVRDHCWETTEIHMDKVWFPRSWSKARFPRPWTVGVWEMCPRCNKRRFRRL